MTTLHRIARGSPKARQLASALLERREFSGHFVVSCAIMLSCLLLGGGTRSGFLSDAVLQFLAIPLLIISLAQWHAHSSRGKNEAKEARLTLWLCVALIMVPVLQLIPLPSWIWTLLPNRHPIEATFDVLGRQMPWMPISVSPNATWLSAISLLPPLAVFLASTQLSYRQRRSLSLLVLATGVTSVFVGLAQVAQGPLSPLRFFAFTNDAEAVGFFANRNHLAAMIYTSILFAAAWAMEAVLAGGRRHLSRLDPTSLLPTIGSFIVLVVLVSGQAMTRSRAGLGLTILALCGVFCLACSNRRNAWGITPARLILGSTTLALVLSAQFALYRLLDRFATDPLADARLAFAVTTITAAKAYMPFGSGIGTFVPVYAMFEQPKDAMIDVFVNHAHDDFLEAWLESGILGIGLMVGFAIWFIPRAVKVWRTAPSEAGEIDRSLARAATMTIALIIVHSFVDYPLRTSAMAAIFAFCCALLTEPVSGFASGCSPTEENPRDDNTTRRSTHRKARAVTTSAGQPHDVAPTHPEPATGRWGEDIDWPREWCNGMQTCRPDRPT